MDVSGSKQFVIFIIVSRFFFTEEIMQIKKMTAIASAANIMMPNFIYLHLSDLLYVAGHLMNVTQGSVQ